MKPKTINIIYWTVTILFCLFFLMDGVMGMIHVEQGKEIMAHLGYPEYIMSILGVAKFAGALGILQWKFNLLKEWAYAGFTFHFLGAMASRAYAGDGAGLIFSPLIFMAFMGISYYLWKKRESVSAVPVN